MPKDKLPKTKGVQNKHLHFRTTFLYQAATYLTLHSPAAGPVGSASSHAYSNRALQMGSDLQAVSRKGQVRLSAELKRTICKCCNTVLIPGRTATHTIENDSKGAKKPWADVLVIGCTFCGAKKRFPVGATKQLKKAQRMPKTTSEEVGQQTDEQSVNSALPPTSIATTPLTSG
ncbi:unnamed protein product [Periconia digitata]|uniref:Rpr2-domain-containing protein n=1 Tax=Periconia digitata TaxID=1303443 RepID=A0A9W4XPY7_9PLEO|nr:unnamed protein product [Periconia digitata]